MPDERYREIVATFKEHILAGDIFQGVPSRRVAFPAPDGGLPDLPAPARHEPRPVHVLPRAGGHGARRLVARTARPGRGTARLDPSDRRDPPARRRPR